MTNDVVRVQVRMSPQLKRRLDRAANERVVSSNLLACRAIEHYLDNIPDATVQALRMTSTYTPPTRWERIRAWLEGR